MQSVLGFRAAELKESPEGTNGGNHDMTILWLFGPDCDVFISESCDPARRRYMITVLFDDVFVGVD